MWTNKICCVCYCFVCVRRVCTFCVCELILNQYVCVRIGLCVLFYFWSAVCVLGLCVIFFILECVCTCWVCVCVMFFYFSVCCFILLCVSVCYFILCVNLSISKYMFSSYKLKNIQKIIKHKKYLFSKEINFF